VCRSFKSIAFGKLFAVCTFKYYDVVFRMDFSDRIEVTTNSEWILLDLFEKFIAWSVYLNKYN
jgi:hypothetical protein